MNEFCRKDKGAQKANPKKQGTQWNSLVYFRVIYFRRLILGMPARLTLALISQRPKIMQTSSAPASTIRSYAAVCGAAIRRGWGISFIMAMYASYECWLMHTKVSLRISGKLVAVHHVVITLECLRTSSQLGGHAIPALMSTILRRRLRYRAPALPPGPWDSTFHTGTAMPGIRDAGVVDDEAIEEATAGRFELTNEERQAVYRMRRESVWPSSGSLAVRVWLSQRESLRDRRITVGRAPQPIVTYELDRAALRAMDIFVGPVLGYQRSPDGEPENPQMDYMRPASLRVEISKSEDRALRGMGSRMFEGVASALSRARQFELFSLAVLHRPEGKRTQAWNHLCVTLGNDAALSYVMGDGWVIGYDISVFHPGWLCGLVGICMEYYILNTRQEFPDGLQRERMLGLLYRYIRYNYVNWEKSLM